MFDDPSNSIVFKCVRPAKCVDMRQLAARLIVCVAVYATKRVRHSYEPFSAIIGEPGNPWVLIRLSDSISESVVSHGAYGPVGEMGLDAAVQGIKYARCYGIKCVCNGDLVPVSIK